MFITFLQAPSLPAGSSAPIVIYTVNYPLKYFAERIGGEHGKVLFPAPPEVDPAYWMPDPNTITDYQKADFIFTNGAHYAQWIEKVTLPQSKLVNTSRSFRDQYIRVDTALTHSHGPKGPHAHEDVASAVWLDLELAARQARAIEKAFIRKKPGLKTTFQQNYTSLEKDLAALDREMKEVSSIDPGMPLIASHPVYDYLARRYNLNVKSVQWEPDEAAGFEQWTELMEILKSHPSRWMLWERMPLDETLEKLESIGMKSIIFDPCGNAPEHGSFVTVMKKNIANLREVFSQ